MELVTSSRISFSNFVPYLSSLLLSKIDQFPLFLFFFLAYYSLCFYTEKSEQDRGAIPLEVTGETGVLVQRKQTATSCLGTHFPSLITSCLPGGLCPHQCPAFTSSLHLPRLGARDPSSTYHIAGEILTTERVGDCPSHLAAGADPALAGFL